MGGAEVLGLDGVIGNFELGKQVRPPRFVWFDVPSAVFLVLGRGAGEAFSICNINECLQFATGCEALPLAAFY